MDIEDKKKKAAELREKAKDSLKLAMGINPIFERINLETFVDCIIEAAILEIAIRLPDHKIEY